MCPSLDLKKIRVKWHALVRLERQCVGTCSQGVATMKGAVFSGATLCKLMRLSSSSVVWHLHKSEKLCKTCDLLYIHRAKAHTVSRAPWTRHERHTRVSVRLRWWISVSFYCNSVYLLMRLFVRASVTHTNSVKTARRRHIIKLFTIY